MSDKDFLIELYARVSCQMTQATRNLVYLPRPEIMAAVNQRQMVDCVLERFQRRKQRYLHQDDLHLGDVTPAT